MPVATSDATLLDRLSELQTSTGKCADGNSLTGARQWFLSVDRDPSGNPFDVAGLGELFDRSNINAQYTEALTGEQGSTGDGMALTLQGDYLALMERACRARRASRIRRSAHAAARWRGHSQASVGVLTRVATAAQDLIAAGATDFQPPVDYNVEELLQVVSALKSQRDQVTAVPEDF